MVQQKYNIQGMKVTTKPDNGGQINGPRVFPLFLENNPFFVLWDLGWWLVTIVLVGKRKEELLANKIFFVCFVKKISMLEGHKFAYGWQKDKIMLGYGTLPVAALTLTEPLEPQFVDAVSRTRPLRSITGELGLARTKWVWVSFWPHSINNSDNNKVASATHKYT